jgi:hypothetical protein
MLGRESYTQEALDHARTTVDRQPADYGALVSAVAASTTDEKVDAARESFDPSSSPAWSWPSTGRSCIGSGWSRARTAIRSTRSNYWSSR